MEGNVATGDVPLEPANSRSCKLSKLFFLKVVCELNGNKLGRRRSQNGDLTYEKSKRLSLGKEAKWFWDTDLYTFCLNLYHAAFLSAYNKKYIK